MRQDPDSATRFGSDTSLEARAVSTSLGFPAVMALSGPGASRATRHLDLITHLCDFLLCALHTASPARHQILGMKPSFKCRKGMLNSIIRFLKARDHVTLKNGIKEFLNVGEGCERKLKEKVTTDQHVLYLPMQEVQGTGG